MTTIKLPLKHGQEIEGEVYHPNMIYDADGKAVSVVYEIPSNCRLHEIQDDKRWIPGIQVAQTIVRHTNAYDNLVECVEKLRTTLAALYSDKGGPKYIRQQLEDTTSFLDGLKSNQQ